MRTALIAGSCLALVACALNQGQPIALPEHPDRVLLIPSFCPHLIACISLRFLRGLLLNRPFPSPPPLRDFVP
jgi:hypothetical protein